MKILFTGMTSAHCKDGQNVSFFRVVAKAYSEIAEVVWSTPKLSWSRADLEKFDLVVLGMSPPTSLASNYIYGSLHVLNLLYESPKLRLIVDSPQMWQYKNSIRAFKRDPEQIFGSFYSNRVNYEEAKTSKVRSSVEAVAEKLQTVKWPTTIVPSLPWLTKDSISRKIPFITEDSIVPLNLDSFLFEETSPQIARKNAWAVENTSSVWWKTLEKTLSNPGESIRYSKKPKDAEIFERIKTSFGLVVPPQDRKVGTWWSYRYIQALNSATPVVTYWNDINDFDSSWRYLGYQIEDMQPYDRQHVAYQQRNSYISNVPSKDESLKTLNKLVVDFQKESV